MSDAFLFNSSIALGLLGTAYTFVWPDGRRKRDRLLTAATYVGTYIGACLIVRSVADERARIWVNEDRYRRCAPPIKEIINPDYCVDYYEPFCC